MRIESPRGDGNSSGHRVSMDTTRVMRIESPRGDGNAASALHRLVCSVMRIESPRGDGNLTLSLFPADSNDGNEN